MTTLADLRNAIDNLLRISTVATSLRLNSNTCERAYEAYVFSLCVEAVRRAGGQAIIKGIISGPNPPEIIFRGGPGIMSSISQDFCYANCTLGSKNFEMHLDIEFEGQSGATHEIDISIYDAEHADFVRTSGRSPKTNKSLIMILECKFYITPLGVNEARAFIGLLSDCSSQKLKGFVSNDATQNLRRFLSKTNSPEPFIDLTPLDTNSEDRFIRFVEQKLRKWAGED